ncbi:hypothetical protein HOH87_04255 [bacterium]|nr:hypothetical protein [bacterium]
MIALFVIIGGPVEAKKRARKRSFKHAPVVYVIDTFSDKNLTSKPEWWALGHVTAGVESNDDVLSPKYVGGYSLVFQAQAKRWYAGGIGSYLGIDASPYKAIKLVVYSPSANASIVTVQLFDDDNHNWEIDIDNATQKVTEDDIFVSSFQLDWEGWKVVTLPLSKFDDDNYGVGDDIWNPSRRDGSGGLVQIQLLAFSQKTKMGLVEFRLDSLKLVGK